MKIMKIASPATLNGLDRLSLAFGALAEPTKNNSIKVNNTKDATTTQDQHDLPQRGAKAVVGQLCQYVLFNPQDFYYFLNNCQSVLRTHFDRETQMNLVRRGIVGYLWGATVVLEEAVPAGYMCVSAANREKVFESDNSFLVDCGFQELKALKIEFHPCSKEEELWIRSLTPRSAS